MCLLYSLLSLINSKKRKRLALLVGLLAVASLLSFSVEAQVSTQFVDGDNNTTIEISEAYPNPASHQITFDYRFNNQQSKGKIIIHNLLGSVVREQELDRFDSRAKINVYDLKAGIYFYTISVDNKSLTTKKFVVKH